jgi:trehalose 6-phosphate phosphatase
VSGRPAQFLAEHLGGVPDLVLVGLYGLERVVGSSVEVMPEAARWRGVVEQAASAAELEAPRGVLVERKGLSVTLHVRSARAQTSWMLDWAAGAADRFGLDVLEGRQSVELRPPLRVDKGTVVEELGAGFDAVCYVGDDLGDVPAFEALRRLARGGAAKVAVAVRSNEVPDELLREADMIVEGPEEVIELLDRLSAVPC